MAYIPGFMSSPTPPSIFLTSRERNANANRGLSKRIHAQAEMREFAWQDSLLSFHT